MADTPVTPPYPRVVLIEDDSFLVGMYVSKMELEHLQAFVASDGEKGLSLARELHPDLVLLDVLLPHMDGFTVLTEMKQDPATRDIPVILLTNLGQKQDIERGMKLGAKDYMVKSNFMPSEVIDRVKAVIEETRPGTSWL